ncbi:MAG: hypothetical protein J6W43_07500 [Prevotella sp.]|nr:hypothetical protein [Prevotella sp.]
MKRLLCTLMVCALVAAVQAKKVKVTIDGTTSPSQTTLYLIINEDTAHAQLVPINDAHFSVNIKVDRDAFIRLHDSKRWPERGTFVLIPDSRHITVNWSKRTIQGSEQSQKLQAVCSEIKNSSPEGFHIDVFTDDPEAWRSAQAQGESIRQSMLEQQKDVFKQQILENKNNPLCAWIAFCYPQLMEGEIEAMLHHMKPKWLNHPILKNKQ